MNRIAIYALFVFVISGVLCMVMSLAAKNGEQHVLFQQALSIFQ